MSIQVIIKFAITALVVVIISEASKQSKLLGAIIASLPLTSLLALSWLYFDTREPEPVAALSMDIFWAVIPSLAFFPLFAWLLRSWHLPYLGALGIASLLTAALYWIYFAALKYWHVV